ncbi:transporter substrate-binding domain-containing protein [Pararhodospirillum oryzae]|uniref:Amino acid ABC transporter n=1 Tax=Pararhodospirillum oryzae TaxID=478448 RepID=A0A512H8I3_9PROT|nr:transporter substrate-binding domain-containing protein [Pararhodospirillum oryzae]GEO81763.1 amino acid ABC transporter [Pararhodospirillum oryzae]
MTLKKTVATLAATLGLLLAAPLSGAASAKAETLRIATEGAFPPFNMVDDQGQAQGFDVDIAKALCAEMNAQCEIVTQDWDGLIPGLLAHKFDAIIASMSITPERQQSVLFSDPYYYNQFHFVGAKDRSFTTTKEGLKGLTIGAQRATVSAQWLADNLADDVTIKLYDTAEEGYMDLTAGRLDLLLNDTYPTFDWLKSPAGQGYELKGDSVINDDKVGIAMRKDDTALAAALNKALAGIIEKGVYAEINAKYFPFSLLTKQ